MHLASVRIKVSYTGHLRYQNFPTGRRRCLFSRATRAQAGLWYEMIRLWTMKEPMTADMPDVQLGTEGPATLANSNGGISARKPRPY